MVCRAEWIQGSFYSDVSALLELDPLLLGQEPGRAEGEQLFGRDC